MAFKYTGDSVLGVSLSVQTNKPLDIRTVVSNTSELYSIPTLYAYEGMTVANASNGNTYMLIDKANIDNSKGWKASYEAIQIITCTQDEYDELALNTDENYKPIDETLGYLHEDTYYYVFEEDGQQKYLSQDWGKDIEDRLSNKADNNKFDHLATKLNELLENVDLNYSTSELISNTYTTIDTTNTLKESIDKLSSNVYTIEESDNKFVTKNDLKGDTDEEDFVFVTLKQYSKDQEQLSNELTTKLINLSDLTITISDNSLLLNDKEIALSENVPNFVCITEDEYNDLAVKDDDTYYCTYDNNKDINTTGYVRQEDLTLKYYTKSEVDALIEALRIELQKQ